MALITPSTRPLAQHAADVALAEPRTLTAFDETRAQALWAARRRVEDHLEAQGYTDRLCYSKWEGDRVPTIQVVPYATLPSYLNNALFRTIYSIWKQALIIFRTLFSPKPLTEKRVNKERAFYASLPEAPSAPPEGKRGTGPLTQVEILAKQHVFTQKGRGVESHMNLLYNYAPLRTGGAQRHFLIVPNPANAARDFRELDEAQYVNTLLLIKRVAEWASREFKGNYTLHVFDKTGKVAGQTQPVFHTHLLITTEKRQERWGRLAMFFRMLIPASPLKPEVLAERVGYYKIVFQPRRAY